MKAMRRQSYVVAVLAAAFAVGVCLSSVAQNAKGDRPATVTVPKTPDEAKALVRAVIQHQMAAEEKGGGQPFMWVQKENGKRGVLTKEMVETKDGIVARLVAVNDRPVTPEERQADDERLSKLLSDPQARAQKLKQQQEDEKRTRKMVAALPDAFVYEPDGTVPGPNGAE